jgi:hypothetical protein
MQRVLERIERLDPARIHPMHGGSFDGELAPRFYRALREEPFGYAGRLLGRELTTAEIRASPQTSRR